MLVEERASLQDYEKVTPTACKGVSTRVPSPRVYKKTNLTVVRPSHGVEAPAASMYVA